MSTNSHAGPDARNDAFATDEATAITGNLFADNGEGSDTGAPGALAVDAVNGDETAVGRTITLPSGARLTVNANGAFTYEPLGAFAGLPVGASTPDSFTYTVADGRQRTIGPGAFPARVDLDGLDGTNGFAVPGVTTSGRSGADVSIVGDVNGDGVDDLLIGANTTGSNGAAYLVFGVEGGPAPSVDLGALDGRNGVLITGTDFVGQLGSSVSAAGDVNGDGIGDIILGAPRSFGFIGASFVVFGRDTGNGATAFPATLDVLDLDGTDGFAVLTPLDARLGVSVSSAGDINGDGVDDVLIGADESTVFSPTPTGISPPVNFAGEAYVVYGRDVAGGAAPFDPFVGVYDIFATERGLSGFDGENGFRMTTFETAVRLGNSVAGGGDVNGDGIDDLIVSAPGADPLGRSGAGAVYVLFGRDDAVGERFDFSVDLRTLNGETGFIVAGGAPNDRLGVDVAFAGDLNGDGADDIALRFAGDSGLSPVIVYGRPGGGFDPVLDLGSLTPDEGVFLRGAEGRASLGASMQRAGDVNADGLDDFIIDAERETYVVFGRDVAGGAPAFGAEIDLRALDGADGFALGDLDAVAGSTEVFDFSVGGGGDLNGDGVDDLVVAGALLDGNGLPDSGETFVVYGRADVAPVTDTATVTVQVTGVEDPGLVVTTTADLVDDTDGATSLREAIAFAAAGGPDGDATTAETITFAAGPGEAFAGGGTVALALGELFVATDVTIDGDLDGDGAPDVTIDAGGASRVFNIAAGDVTLDGLTVANGDGLARPGSLDGGGIFIDGAASLDLSNAVVTGGFARSGGGIFAGPGSTLVVSNTRIADNAASSGAGLRVAPRAEVRLEDSTVSGNEADIGGGIRSTGTLTAVGATLSDNAAVRGGGLYVDNGALLVNVTVADNTGDDVLGGDGAGVFVESGAFGAINTTITGNGGEVAFVNNAAATLVNSLVLGNAGSDVGGGVAPTLRNSLIGGDPAAVFAALGSSGGGLLADNGGPVPTVALRADRANPALDAADDAAAPAADARGVTRIDQTSVANNGSAIADLGAFELDTVLNAAPEAIDDTATTPEDLALRLPAADLLVNDADPDGDALRVVAVGEAQNGAVALDDKGDADPANDEVVFTPDADFAGEASFTYTVADDAGGEARAVVAVTVTPVNDPPVLAVPIADQQATQDRPFDFTLPPETFTDIDPGDTLTLSATLADGSPLPGWLSFDPGSGRFSGTPAQGDVGALEVRVTARDAAGAFVRDAFRLAVEDVNDPPSVRLSDRRGFIREDRAITAPLKVADIEVEDDALGEAILSLGGPDADLFEIGGDALFLRAGAALDFEASPTLDVTVFVDDPAIGTVPEDSDALSLAVFDRDEFDFKPVLSLEAFGAKNRLGNLREPGDGANTKKLFAYIDDNRSDRFEAAELAQSELLTRNRRDVGGDGNPIEGAGSGGTGLDLLDIYAFGVANPNTPDGFQFGDLRISAEGGEAFTLGIDTAGREAVITRTEPDDPDSGVLDVEAGRRRRDGADRSVSDRSGGKTVEEGETVGFALKDGLAATNVRVDIGRGRDLDDDAADILLRLYDGDTLVAEQVFDLENLAVETDRSGREFRSGVIEASVPGGLAFDRVEVQADGGVSEGRGASFALNDIDFALV